MEKHLDSDPVFIFVDHLEALLLIESRELHKSSLLGQTGRLESQFSNSVFRDAFVQKSERCQIVLIAS